MPNHDPYDISTRCWCGSLWWQDHRHFSVTPVEFGRPASQRANGFLLALGLTLLGACVFLASSCSSTAACKPLGQELANAAAQALVCAVNQPLAGCEQTALQSVSQITPDGLVCAESVLVEASRQPHVTGNCVTNPGDPSCYPPVHDAMSPNRSK